MDNIIHAHKLMDFIQANPKISDVHELKMEFDI